MECSWLRLRRGCERVTDLRSWRALLAVRTRVDVTPRRGEEGVTSKAGGATYMLWSFGSFSRSAESSTTVLSPRFFHQCETSGVSATTSPALCTIGTAQFDGVFDDLAFDDVDDRRPVGVAVPRHDAARLDGELAHAEQCDR